MNKNALKSYAVWARQKLINDVAQKAFEYAITKDGFGEENAKAIGERALSNDEVKQRSELVNQIKLKGFEQVMEEVAYTWFNRFIALRYMEVNGFLPSRIRVFTNENNEFKPEILKEAINIDFECIDKSKVFELIDSNDTDALYKYLIISQCNDLGKLLPGMFEKIANYTELLFPDNLLRPDSVIGKMISDIDESDWGEQVEILGWLYQFYNIEPKAVVFGRKGNAKIKKEEIPAATQLFTPDWIVRYMVQNSLGRIFINDKCVGITDEKERINKEKEIAQQMGWQYYLPEAEQTPEVRAQLNANHISLLSELTSIKLIDPCMGSGHILVYAFEVLMQIYLECGYTERDATSLILENNLFGLDIDDRAYQLAYFAVMMKARSYDRRILTRNIKPNVYSIKESNFLADSWQKISSDEKFREIFQTVVDTFIDAKEYGSILNVPDADYDYALSVIDDFEQSVPVDFEAQILRGKTDDIRALVNPAKLLSQKYDVVVTNPPYMGSSGMNEKLSKFVKTHFTNEKNDLFSCFITKGNGMIKKNGYNAMVTMQSWMFLSSFENMRKKILDDFSIIDLLHMDNMVMGIAFGTSATVFRKKIDSNYIGTYNQITLKDINKNGTPNSFPVSNNRFNQIPTTNFSKIPGSPIAYWVSKNMLGAYEAGKNIGEIAFPKTGMTTGDNNRFLRMWFEVNINNAKFDVESAKEAQCSEKKWFPYCKGGGFRRWYGYNEYLVNWFNDGYEIKNNIKANGLKAASVRSENMYFKPLITWSAVTSGLFSCRYCFGGALFDSGGSSISVPQNAYYLLSVLNGKIGQYVLDISNATINYQPGDIAGIPIIFEKVERVESNAQLNIQISKTDWDSYETSWDFKRNPLV